MHDSITVLLQKTREGDAQAQEQLLSAVYANLRALAAVYLRSERRDHTLQATALVHEAYLRLFAGSPVDWQDRSHFFAVAARQMRRILVDHARQRYMRRNSTISLDEESQDERTEIEIGNHFQVAPNVDLLALDEALGQLEQIAPREALGVQLRYFVGLTLKEAAEVLNIDVATVKRDWVFAKSWLYSYLKENKMTKD